MGRLPGTAQVADEWISVRPGSDAALLLAVVQVLFAEDRVRLKHLQGQVNGLEELQAACQPYTPERVNGFTGVVQTDEGNGTLTSSLPFFTQNHVGALFRWDRAARQFCDLIEAAVGKELVAA